MTIEKIENVNRITELLKSYGFEADVPVSIYTEEEKLKKITYRKYETIRYVPFLYVIEWDFTKNMYIRYNAVFDGTFDALEISNQNDVNDYHEIFSTVNQKIKSIVDELIALTIFPSINECCRKLGWKRKYHSLKQIWYKYVDLCFGPCRINAVFDNNWNFSCSYITPVNSNYEEIEDEFEIYENDCGWFSVSNEHGVDEVTNMFQEMLESHNEEVEKLKKAIKKVKERK